MSTRMTFVIEYADGQKLPGFSPDLEILGGTLVRFGVEDAVEEIAVLIEHCDPLDVAKARAELMQRRAARRAASSFLKLLVNFHREPT